VAHSSVGEGFAMEDFHTLKERVSMMRTNYQHLLTNKNLLEYNGCARFTIDNISIVTQP
jgi:hypothetical protein